MLTTEILKIVEDRIDEKYNAHLVPFDKAYPTSGEKFIRLSPISCDVSRDNDRLSFDVQIRVTCSARIRTYARQNEFIPHLEVVDLSEKMLFWVLSFVDFSAKLKQKFPKVDVYGLIESDYLTLDPEPVYADFYDSAEIHERKPAGLKIDQSFTLPRVSINLDCGNLPNFILELIGKPYGWTPE